MLISNHKWLDYLLGAIYFLIAHVSVCAQEHNPYFTYLTYRDGLPSNKIYHMYAAKDGKIYIGHSKGLSSFDGAVVKNFPNRDLPFTELTNVMESEEGTIFCEAFNNNVFVLKNDTVIDIKQNTNKFGFKASAIYNNIIISQNNDSLVFYNTKQGRYYTKSISQAVNSDSTKDIVYAGFNLIDDVLYRYEVDREFRIHKSVHKSRHQNTFHNCNNNIFLLNLKEISDIYYYNWKRNVGISNYSFHGIVNYVSVVDSSIWICTTDGVFLVRNGMPVKHLYSGHSITCVVKTFDNTLLLGTLEEGIIRIPNLDLTTVFDDKAGISAMAFNGEDLYLGTKNGRLLKQTSEDDRTQVMKSFVSSVNLIMPDLNSGEVLLNCNNQLLLNNGKPGGFSLTIKDHQYLDDGILFATNDGLYYYSKTTPPFWLTKLIEKRQSPYYKLSIFNEFVASAKFNFADSSFYINTYEGLFRYSLGDTEVRRMIEPYCVLSDMTIHEGKLLLASKDKGLLKFDGRKYNPYKPEVFGKRICLKMQYVNNELWVLSSDALISIIKDSTTVYSNMDGIPFNLVQGFSVNADQLIFHDGRSVFKLKRYLKSKGKEVLPSIQISKLRSTQTNEEIKNSETISYKNNTIQIDFSLLSFRGSDNIHPAYRINNGQLVHLSNTSREITLNNLAPDNYEISFYIAEGDHIIIETEKRIRFVIRPPIYKTWYFTLIVVMLAALLVFIISRSILRRYKREAAQVETQLRLQQELDKSILSSIKSQMNPHFLFNALNTIQSYIYTNDKTNASKYISKFSNLTRSILELSNKEFISIDEEVNTLSLYLELEKMRFEDSFIYTLKVDPALNKEATKMPSMLVQPYVENAIKHGLLHKKTDRRLYIEFKKIEKGLQITIDDNGIGRRRSIELNQIKNRQHQSFAMNANKKRLEILNNNYKNIHFEVEDKLSPLGEAIGTKVIIILPLR